MENNIYIYIGKYLYYSSLWYARGSMIFDKDTNVDE